MSKQSIAEISQKSGKSVSTVSKVLRNCPGVDYETREAVRMALGEDAPYKRSRSRGDRGGVCVILPDNPKFFWGRALSALDGEEVTLKIYSAIYQDRGDREVARCLSEAIEEGVSAIILAAHPREALRQELFRLSREMLVIQLCEYTPIPNSFFVGSDFYEDGRALAASLVEECGEARPVVGVLRPTDGGYAARERVRGFLEGLDDRGEIVWIDQPDVPSLYASHLARFIDGTGKKLDYLYGNNGMTALDCDALYKLREQMKTRYIGFEFPTSAQKHWDGGRIAALAVQAPEEQMKLAMSLCRRYLDSRMFPDEKLYRIPSEYLKNSP